MNRTVLSWSLLVSGVLTGCNTSTRPAATVAPLESGASNPTTRVAWGQRVALPVGKRAVGRVEVNGVQVPATDVGTEMVFDLPPPPAGASSRLPATPAEYIDRKWAQVEVFGPDAVTPFLDETWPVYGSVVPGEVNVLLTHSPAAGCAPEAFPGTVVVNTASTERLCFFTLNIGQQDTFAAIQDFGSRPNVLAVDRNVVFSLDGGEPSFDPTCSATSNLLDPNAKGYDLIQGASLTSLVGVGQASPKGKGVTVAVIGGGVNPGWLGSPPQLAPGQNFVNPGQPPFEAFACDFDRDGKNDLGGHDTYVAQIIHTLAPEARIVPLKTCNALGDCRSAYNVMALMSLIGPAQGGRVIVNHSNGGPVKDHTMFELLRQPELNDPRRFLMVASAGNQGVAVTHYPASYAPGALPLVGLPNVVAAGAFGQDGAGVYRAAIFNTTANFEILGPGINVCPASATQFRCSASASYPDNLGLNGTSHAAPFVAAVAALYAEVKPGQNLRDLLMTSVKADVPGSAAGRVQFVP